MNIDRIATLKLEIIYKSQKQLNCNIKVVANINNVSHYEMFLFYNFAAFEILL